MSETTWKCENCGFEKNTGHYCGMCGAVKIERKESRMQKLACEMCGGNDIVKENGLYVCQHCGTKYTVEEAKQLFIEGSIKIDNSHKTENMYCLARRAYAEQDYKGSQKYYEQILLEQPDKWEPVFYAAYCKAYDCDVKDIENNIQILKNKLNTTFTFLRADNNVNQEREIANIAALINELVFDLDTKMVLSYDLSDDPNKDYYQEEREDVDRHESMLELLDFLINQLAPYTENESIVYNKFRAKKQAVSIMFSLVAYKSRALADSEDRRFRNRIEKEQLEIAAYDHSYKIEKTPSKGACFIATAVYGSYDCPQVWVLRRFRDEVLMPMMCGKVFVKTYYALSPKLLRLVGDTKLFQNICVRILDKFVYYLKGRGFSDKPYKDEDRLSK